MARSSARGGLTILRLTPGRMDDLGAVLRGTWGNGCWCIYPRCTAKTERALPGPGNAAERRRSAMTKLARRRRAPGLLAYRDGKPIGWIAIAPRPELVRADTSKATPRVDDVDVWVVPCITVKKQARGQGVALSLIRSAVEYAKEQGAPAVEAYPRAGKARVHDDFAYFGTEGLFRQAGFKVIREPLPGLPKGWVPRVTMRIVLGRSRAGRKGAAGRRGS